MTEPLAARVVALIGPPDAAMRTLAVACAEAGAAVAIATQEKTQDEEFAAQSIANEVWVIGRDHFVRPLDCAEPTAVMAFADEVWDRLGRCDALVALHELVTSAPLDELSPDEWAASIRVNLTAPYLAIQAFGRLMERAGRGLIIVSAGLPGEGDAAYAAARAGLGAFAGHVAAAWANAGVTIEVAHVARGQAAATILAVLGVPPAV